MSKPLDLAGHKYGRLKPIRRAENAEDGHARWLCLCDCGKTVVVTARYLKTGHTRSCGCLQSEKAAESASQRNITHGDSKEPLYHVWQSMRARCNNHKHRAYSNYGGRGISVCAEWNDSYLTFKEWAIKSGYTRGKQLDRIDNNWDYCPQNCRWVSAKENSNNKRTNRHIYFGGRTMTISEWATEKGLAYNTLYSRLVDGWPVERALSEQTGRVV